VPPESPKEMDGGGDARRGSRGRMRGAVELASGEVVQGLGGGGGGAAAAGGGHGNHRGALGARGWKGHGHGHGHGHGGRAHVTTQVVELPTPDTPAVGRDLERGVKGESAILG
jgi:hypothetical protein